ncbi:MAG: hypothetical protein HY363_03370 [Candidatus Aenigmarchaeota archaeon]|nr:hypothetical protein [Candidatus Aenigmarchaeota archaeon]
MEPTVKEDIQNVLNQIIDWLSQDKPEELLELSNHVIHDASIFQDEDSISFAVLVYALYKTILRCKQQEECKYGQFLEQLKKMQQLLLADNFDDYRNAIKKLFAEIKKSDQKLALYIEEVLAKARIKKGSKIHEHGISIARAAEMLNISQWELANYIGKTTIPEAVGKTVKERLAFARKHMKKLVFDAGPIISLTTNNLLWTLLQLKKTVAGEFYIPSCVKKELIERPLQTKKFKFEALQVESQVEAGVLTIVPHESIAEQSNELYQLANRIFYAQNRPMTILQMGEIQTLASAIMLDASAAVVDERITRALLEEPDRLRQILKQRLHTSVRVDRNALDVFSKKTRHVQIVRSAELAVVALENGILDKFIVHVPDAKRTLLESVLWGLKLNGCAISEEEINVLLKSAEQ